MGHVVKVFCLGLAMATMGCGLRTVVKKYHPTTAKEAVQAFSDAFNADELPQLSLLDTSDETGCVRRTFRQMRKRLKVWRLVRFTMGEPIEIRRGLTGVEVKFEYHDGRCTARRWCRGAHCKKTMVDMAILTLILLLSPPGLPADDAAATVFCAGLRRQHSRSHRAPDALTTRSRAH